MSPFSCIGRNLCGLSLAFVKDWRVVHSFLHIHSLNQLISFGTSKALSPANVIIAWQSKLSLKLKKNSFLSITVHYGNYKFFAFISFQEVSDNVEIIFVSSDRSIDEMKSYLKESHGSWLSVEHGSELAQALKQHFGVR